MRSLLRIEELEVKYGDFTAVSSATLMIPEGKITALIGANGAGKSSLLNAAAGLAAPSRGHVFYRDEEITGKSAGDIMKRGLCLVPQGGHCFDRMSVEDNLLMGSYPRALRRAAGENLERIYSLFPVLREKKKEPAGTLSGGQRQMTAIGRALMSDPGCILFDEISLGLAPVTVGELYACIRELNRGKGTTLVLVEQDMERALAISDFFGVMLKGSVVMDGRPGDYTREEIKKAYFGI